MEPNKVTWTYCGWNSSDVRLHTNPKGPWSQKCWRFHNA